MKKRLTLSLLLSFTSLCIIAQNWVVNNLRFSPIDATTAMCIGIYDKSKSLPTEIPDKIQVQTEKWDVDKNDYVYNTYTVVEIRYRCFSESDITSMKIPNSVKAIGFGAFEHCNKLQSIHFSSNLKEIGNSCFAGCEKLEQIDLPSSLVTIGDGVFRECKSLKKVSMSNCHLLESTGNTIFYECSSLESVDLSGCNSLLNIGNCAFAFCSNLESVKLPDHLEVISDGAFELTSLKKITIPNSVQSIGISAFVKCKQLKSVLISSTSKLKTIGTWAFSECISMSEIALPENLISIGNGAFKDCYTIASINIPRNVTTIDEEAFMGCEGLKEVRLPASLTSLGIRAFAECPNIEKVYALMANPFTIRENTFHSKTYQNATLYVHNTSKYKQSYAWSEFQHIRDIDGEYTYITTKFDITSKGCGEVVIPKEEDHDIGAGHVLISLFDGATIRDEQKVIEVMHWVVQTGVTLQFVPDKGYKVDEVLIAKSDTDELKEVTSELVPTGKDGIYTLDVKTNTTLRIVVTFGPNGSNKEGDLTEDGEVNGTDLVQLIEYVLTGRTDVKAADLNGDGQVNGTDLVKLVNMILGKE